MHHLFSCSQTIVCIDFIKPQYIVLKAFKYTPYFISAQLLCKNTQNSRKVNQSMSAKPDKCRQTLSATFTLNSTNLSKFINSCQQGWNGSLICRVGSGTKYTEISGPGRVGSVTHETLRYQPNTVLCCINCAQILNRKIYYHSIKLGKLAVLARSWELSVFYTCKDSQIYKSFARAGYSNCVGVHWLSV